MLVLYYDLKKKKVNSVIYLYYANVYQWSSNSNFTSLLTAKCLMLGRVLRLCFDHDLKIILL